MPLGNGGDTVSVMEKANQTLGTCKGCLSQEHDTLKTQNTILWSGTGKPRQCYPNGNKAARCGRRTLESCQKGPGGTSKAPRSVPEESQGWHKGAAGSGNVK